MNRKTRACVRLARVKIVESLHSRATDAFSGLGSPLEQASGIGQVQAREAKRGEQTVDNRILKKSKSDN